MLGASRTAAKSRIGVATRQIAASVRVKLRESEMLSMRNPPIPSGHGSAHGTVMDGGKMSAAQRDGLEFFSERKVVTSRWPSA